MTSRERLAAADARMTELLAGAVTVSEAAARLHGDVSRLSWLPIDLGRGDMLSTLSRVTALSPDEIAMAYYQLVRQTAERADTAHYTDLAAADTAAALERGAPRAPREDD